ncbi:MAG: hypothetical protein P8Y21_15275 [Gemmatimonadales bacterium]
MTRNYLHMTRPRGGAAQPRLYRAAGAHLRESVFRADDVASLNLQQRAAWNAVEELFIARLEAAEKLLRSTRLV